MVLRYEKAFEPSHFDRYDSGLIIFMWCHVCADYLKTRLQYLLPKEALTAFGGYMAQVEIPAIKNYLIRWFI